jgi:hypothetical protein
VQKRTLWIGFEGGADVRVVVSQPGLCRHCGDILSERVPSAQRVVPAEGECTGAQVSRGRRRPVAALMAYRSSISSSAFSV